MSVETIKKCSKCGEEKPYGLFHLNKNKTDGRNSYCISCISAYKKKYKQENRDAIRIADKKYAEVSKDKINARHKKWRENNKEKEREQRKARYHANSDKIHEARSKNKEKLNDKMKELMHGLCRSKFYLKNLPPSDKATMENGNIKVMCKACFKYFFPEYIAVRNRSLAYRGMAVTGENNFYCSGSCKNSCLIFGAKANGADPRLRKPKSETAKTRACQTKTLKQLQCDHNHGQSYCEKCGDPGHVDLHHKLPVAQFAQEAINPAGHMLLCVGCHVDLHRVCA